MPVYQYACTACGRDLEVRQSFSDDPLTECSVCGGRLRKVLTPVGVVFKGSGFYRTDSRATASNGGAAKDSPASGDGGAKPSDGAKTSGTPESGTTTSGTPSPTSSPKPATAG